MLSVTSLTGEADSASTTSAWDRPFATSGAARFRKPHPRQRQRLRPSLTVLFRFRRCRASRQCERTNGMRSMAQAVRYPGSPGLPAGPPPGAPGNNEAVAPQRLADLEALYLAHHGRIFRAACRVTGSAND